MALLLHFLLCFYCIIIGKDSNTVVIIFVLQFHYHFFDTIIILLVLQNRHYAFHYQHYAIISFEVVLNCYCYSYLATASSVDICNINAHDNPAPDAVSGTAIKTGRSNPIEITATLNDTFSDSLCAIDEDNTGYSYHHYHDDVTTDFCSYDEAIPATEGNDSDISAATLLLLVLQLMQLIVLLLLPPLLLQLTTAVMVIILFRLMMVISRSSSRYGVVMTVMIESTLLR